MVSGIGPSDALETLGVPLLVDLPGVGKGMWVSHTVINRSFSAQGALTSSLQDQTFYGVSYKVNITTQSILTTDPAARALATQQYLTNRTGRLTGGGSNLVGTCLPLHTLPLKYLSHPHHSLGKAPPLLPPKSKPIHPHRPLNVSI